MEQSASKRSLLHPRVGTMIGIAVIIAAVIAVLMSGPHEVEHDDLFGNAQTLPTVVVTNLVGQTNYHQAYTYNDVSITFTGAAQASKFSDDEKITNGYTVRLYLQTLSNNAETIGVKYATLAHLLLANGQSEDAGLVSISAVEMPGEAQSGYIDFPVPQRVDLAHLKLRFDTAMIPLTVA